MFKRGVALTLGFDVGCEVAAFHFFGFVAYDGAHHVGGHGRIRTQDGDHAVTDGVECFGVEWAAIFADTTFCLSIEAK